jgi:iron(III) transport system substrate-binding protein
MTGKSRGTARAAWRWLPAVAAAGACAALSACASTGTPSKSSSTTPSGPAAISSLVAQAKSEKGLVIYGNAPIDYLKPVIAAFERAYPGITATETDLTDNQVFSKYQAEAAQGARTADLLMASAPASWVQAVQNGATRNVTPLGLANFPAETDQGHGVYVMSPEPILTTYNPKLLKPSEVPTSYAQLAAYAKANPSKYKLASYPIDNPLAYAAYYGLIHILGADKVWQDVDALAPTTKTFSEGLDGLQAMIQGGVSMGYFTSGLAQGVIPHYKGLAEYTFMTDATPLIPRAIAVSAKATSPASAQLFLDFLFSKAGQDALCAGGFEASMNDYTPPGCAGSLAYLRTKVPAASIYTVPINQTVLDAKADITQKWNQAFHR